MLVSLLAVSAALAAVPSPTALAVQPFPTLGDSLDVGAPPSLAQSHSADHVRVYASGLPLPPFGSAGLGVAWLPSNGRRHFAPLVGLEGGAIWFAGTVQASVGAYGGARFIATPQRPLSFVAEAAVGPLWLGDGSGGVFAPYGRLALGVRKHGKGLHWDALVVCDLVPFDSSLPLLPAPAFELGFAF